MTSKKISTLNLQNYSKLVSNIGFFGPLWGVGINDGYGYAAIRLIQAWQRMGIPVWANDDTAPILFSMGQPPFYHDRVEGKLNIGYTAWESTEIPKSWVHYMNQMDEIWTMCEEMKRVFERYLDVPVRVLHHGIDRNDFPVSKRVLKKLGPDAFETISGYDHHRDLHIGGHAPRKGAKEVVEVFCDTFHENNSDVQLILKGYKFDSLPQRKNITVIRDKYSHEEMLELYQSCHGMIYPCKGEGFGLVPFQAASMGIPTAVTEWSGPADYIERCFPIRAWKMTDCDYEPHLGQWCEPSLEDVHRWFCAFYDYPEQFFNLAFDKATKNEAYWSWDNQARLAVEYMIENLK